jgi:hypothetical protein
MAPESFTVTTSGFSPSEKLDVFCDHVDTCASRLDAAAKNHKRTGVIGHRGHLRGLDARRRVHERKRRRPADRRQRCGVLPLAAGDITGRAVLVLHFPDGLRLNRRAGRGRIDVGGVVPTRHTDD